MSLYVIYVLLVMGGGVLPHTIQVRKVGNKRIVEMRAILWSLKVTGRQWCLRVFLHQHLRKTVWQGIKHLQPPSEP
jgi:hypothetical protein